MDSNAIHFKLQGWGSVRIKRRVTLLSIDGISFTVTAHPDHRDTRLELMCNKYKAARLQTMRDERKIHIGAETAQRNPREEHRARDIPRPCGDYENQLEMDEIKDENNDGNITLQREDVKAHTRGQHTD